MRRYRIATVGNISRAGIKGGNARWDARLGTRDLSSPKGKINQEGCGPCRGANRDKGNTRVTAEASQGRVVAEPLSPFPEILNVASKRSFWTSIETQSVPN